MAYEGTDVPVSRSQDGLRGLIYRHGGTGVMLISQPPREGFEAFVTLSDKPYHVRFIATCKEPPARNKAGYKFTSKQTEDWKNREERRVWRVLYYHLKSVFEAADSGVLDFRELIMPYLVTPDGRTLAEHVLPKLDLVIAANADKLLTSGG